MKRLDLFKLINSTFDDVFGNFNYYHTQTNGKTKNESGVDELGQWTKSSYQSDDGTISYTSFVRVGNGYPINSEQSKLNDLKDKMDQAVINQEFEKAAELRDRIKLLENNSKTINQLKMELKSYVEKQEFEKAAEVRDKIKDLEK